MGFGPVWLFAHYANKNFSVASGGDWRIGSLYALLQTMLPLIVFISVGLLNTGLKGKKTKAKRYADYS